MQFDKMVLLLIAKIHVRSLAVMTGFILCATGSLLIYLGVHDTGFLDFKTVFIQGRLQTGMVGLIVILFGVLLIVWLLREGERSHRSIELEYRDGRKIRIVGVNHMTQTVRLLQETDSHPDRISATEVKPGEK